MLVNYAGDKSDSKTQGLKTSVAEVQRSFATNALSSVKITMSVLPGMIERNYGRIVMMSASDEVLATLPPGKRANGHDYPEHGIQSMIGAGLGLRMSKSAVNTLTRTLTEETLENDIHINAVCPGYLHSEESEGKRAKCVDTVVWLVIMGSFHSLTSTMFVDAMPPPHSVLYLMMVLVVNYSVNVSINVHHQLLLHHQLPQVPRHLLPLLPHLLLSLLLMIHIHLHQLQPRHLPQILCMWWMIKPINKEIGCKCIVFVYASLPHSVAIVCLTFFVSSLFSFLRDNFINVVFLVLVLRSLLVLS